MATASQNWQNLTDDERVSWTNFARQRPTIDALGQSILLSGQQAYNKINTRRLQDSAALLTDPPIVAAPDAFVSISQAADIGAGAFALTFSDALPSGAKVELWGAVTDSAGISYVENLYRFITFSAADETSPWTNQTEVEAVLGTLAVGQTLHIKAAVYEPASGQSSTFLRDKVVVSTT